MWFGTGGCPGDPGPIARILAGDVSDCPLPYRSLKVLSRVDFFDCSFFISTIMNNSSGCIT